MPGSRTKLIAAFVASASFTLGFADASFGKPGADNTGTDVLKSAGGVAGAGLDGKPPAAFSHPYGYHLQPILEKIKATSDQRQKIVSVVHSYRSKIQPLRDEYKLKRQEFISSMTNGGAAETIMTKQVELSHLASEITSKYTLMRLEIRRVLNPEQILLMEDYARQHGWNSH